MNRATPPHILTLVAVNAVGALATNVFLPSLPGMALDFAVDYTAVQLTISVYLAANAVVQVIAGPLSDRFGRRPVMLGAFALFVVSSAATLFATSLAMLLALRALQASAAAGMVLSRAIVRDMVAADEAASRLGYITMGMTVMPMIGPVIGGLLDAPLGWRGGFLVLLAVGAATLALVSLDLGETNRTRSASFGAQFRAWPELLAAPRFWFYALAAGFTGGTYFAFLGGGPLVASATLGMAPAAFGANLVFIGLGYMLGNFLSGRHARAVGIDTMMLAGNAVAALGMAVALALFFAGVIHPLSLFGPVVLLGVGNGLTLPSAIAGIVSQRPHLAGAAAGLGGAIQITISALASLFAGWAVGTAGDPVALVATMLGTTLIAIAATVAARAMAAAP